MKKIFLFLMFMSLGGLAIAETVNLNDGKTIVGKILKQDFRSVTVEVNGTEITYFADEIKDIDGKPFIASQVVPVPIQTASGSMVNGVSAKTEEDPIQKRALILKFIEVFGTRRAMSQNLEAMLTALDKQKPEIAAKIRERFKVDEIIEKLVPLYDKNFTSQELNTYIEFYASENGTKLVNHIGDIMKESIEVSANYLKEKFPEIIKEK